MSDVLSFTAQIVAAHVSRNAIKTDELPQLIHKVHRALLSSGEAETAAPKNEPAIDVKRSVRSDHITCLECGRQFSMLRRHLRSDHRLTADEYREKWNLPRSYPMTAPNYAKTRSELAKSFGLGQVRAKKKRQ